MFLGTKRRDKSWLLCAFCALTIFAVTACGNGEAANGKGSSKGTDGGQPGASQQASSGQEREVENLFGTTVIKGTPQRIASLHPWITDFLLAMGITPHAAVSAGPNESGFSPYFQSRLTNTVNLGWQIPDTNFEAILGSGPDLIIATQNQKEVYDQLTKIAPTIGIEPVKDDQGVRRMRDTMRQLAVMLGTQDQAEAALAEYDKQAQEAREQVKQAIGDKTVMFLRMTDKELRYYSKSLYEVLYDDLGMTPPPLIPDSSVSFESLSAEKLPEVNPDYIFLLSESEDKRSSIESLAIWKQLNAVKNNHVYTVDYDLWFQGFGPIANELIMKDVVDKLTKK
jgi:iron complex transport system substrate-binding protein